MPVLMGEDCVYSGLSIYMRGEHLWVSAEPSK